MLRRLLEASARAAGQPHSSSLPTATLAPVLLPSQAVNLTAQRPPPNSPGGLSPPLPHHDPQVAAPSLAPSAAHQHQNSSLYLQPAQSDNESFEYSILAAFSDMETVFLACISTLLPLIVALGIAFGVRHVWRKYKDRRTSTASGLPWYRGVCSRDNTCESLRHSQSNIQHPQTTQILSAQDLVNGMGGPRYICETEVMEDVGLGPSTKMQYTSPGSHTSKNANGNIITLTLKNNHLIVETEERAVVMEDTGYLQDSGCSVIVEVPPGYGNDDPEPQNQGSSSDDLSGRAMSSDEQQALVHREEIPEDRSCGGFDNARLFGSINTGLSQSDLSISSHGDSVNPSYRYGNQLEYEAGHFGYPMYVDSLLELPKAEIATTSASTKWVEFDKSPDTEKTLLEDSKTPSIEKDVADVISETCNNKEDSSLEQQDSTDLSNSVDTTTTVRSNPQHQLRVNGADDEVALINNKPVITGAILKDELAMQEDTFQEQQRKLGNGTLTPEHTDKSSASRPETNNKEQQQQQQNNGKQQQQQQPEASSFVPTHKRTGSIPPRLIEETATLEFSERKKPPNPPLDIYSQIKTSILPGLSPKFELLQNEVSPVDDNQS